MAEIPELLILTEQMDRELKGRVISGAQALQPKCLNVSVEEFCSRLKDKTIGPVGLKGKWITVQALPGETLLLNLGMGADARFHEPGATLPAKYQVLLAFHDGSALSCRYWWFGHAHVVASDRAAEHELIRDIGPLATSASVSPGWFRSLIAANRGAAVKGLLMDQTRISGIGNAYMHDILFKAGIHPLRKCKTLTETEADRLHAAINEVLARARDLGGMERDLYGKGGSMEAFQKLTIIGYKEGQPCPVCGSAIERIKTGSTRGFICPKCQSL